MRRTLTEEEKTELNGYILESIDKYIKHSRSFIPGYVALELNSDVHLALWGKILHPGVYHLWGSDEAREGIDPSWIWVLTFDEDSVIEDLERAKSEGRVIEHTDEDGNTMATITGSGSFKVNLSRVDITEDRPLTLAEMAVWVAMEDAVSSEDTQRARRILQLAYPEYPAGEGIEDEQAGSSYARRKSTNVKEKHLDLVSGTVTNAIFGRGPSSIGPAAYFSEDPVPVKSGNGGNVLVSLVARAGTDIDAPVGAYQPSDRTRFWLDPLYTLAYSGHSEITGSDILRQNGYSNPYASTAQEVMRDALEHITRAMGTFVSIDVTNEKRNKRRGNATVSGSVRLKPLVNAELDLDTLTTDDGEIVRDFTVRLVYRGSDVGEALPVAQHDRSRGMFTQVSLEDVTFKGMRLTIDDRQMWRYVLRRIKSKKQSDTILFETMWRDLELAEPDVSEYQNPGAVDAEGNRTDLELADDATIERRKRDAVRKKRERMTTTLYKMLDQKRGILFDSYQRKRTGGVVVGVTIHPIGKEAS